VYLLISLKGDLSSEVAQNLSNIEGVNSVSLVSGGVAVFNVYFDRCSPKKALAVRVG
jgi:hypothetical protein